jgi:hypothetical protein
MKVFLVKQHQKWYEFSYEEIIKAFDTLEKANHYCSNYPKFKYYVDELSVE